MLYRLKPKFQKFAKVFASSKLTANQASFLGTLFFLMTAFCLFLSFSKDLKWPLMLVPIFLIFRIVFNALDGMIAREKNTASPAGEVMNELLDVIGDNCIYGMFFFNANANPILVGLILASIWASEFIGYMGRALPGNARRHESIGGGKSERSLWIGGFALSLYFWPDGLKYQNHFLSVILILVLLTSILRCLKLLKAIQSKGEKDYVSFTPFGR